MRNEHHYLMVGSILLLTEGRKLLPLGQQPSVVIAVHMSQGESLNISSPCLNTSAWSFFCCNKPSKERADASKEKAFEVFK